MHTLLGAAGRTALRLRLGKSNVMTMSDIPESLQSSEPRPSISTQDVLTANEVAAMLRLHPVTVRLKAASGEIPGKQIGNRWRFSRARIEQLLGQTS